jgi:NTP pyrophosphatase (non-canonical NTP hydrolase)
MTNCFNISKIAEEIHKNAKAHGWWDCKRSIPELLCLIHSEVSEALEAYRKMDWDNLAEELADIIIRVFDMAESLDIEIEKEILRKHEINKKRPYRHGGKKC